ncbi:MAG: hypothetical protein GY715_20915, partial [Planctomycetes bacterium]|nr:hypothetical protein [Planctomycetota bacterium]
YLETVGTAPWVFQAFTPMAVTPNLDNPNGVFAYAANRYMSDTVSVIDPVTGSEVDLDGDPATESIPWQHPWWHWLTWDEWPNYLAGISRIELDGDVLDRNLGPRDVGLTPDGTLLYVANQAGSIQVVDVAETHDVVGTLTANGNLAFAAYLEVARKPVQGKVYVYVEGTDAAG